MLRKRFFRIHYPRRRRRSSLTGHYLRYRPIADRIIKSKVSNWNQLLHYPVKRVTIRNQRSRWGSCSELGNLNFNYKLIFLPEHLLDYVVVHELCHLQELNHSPKFWSLVEAALPEYRIYRRELRSYEKNQTLTTKYLEQYRTIIDVVPQR